MSKRPLAAIIDDMQKHIQPLNINGMQGRMLRLPAPKKKTAKRHILLIYGHHASLERMYGIAEALNDYGEVIMPDLPGCGGMQSFYSIGMKPNLDNMADYLASFVTLKYRQKKVTIIGMSLGFVIATRMLQRYPELAKKVDLLISVAGLAHKYDITFSPTRKLFYSSTAKIFSNKLTAGFFYHILLHPELIKLAYGRTYNARKKLGHLSDEERKLATAFEVTLWRGDDTRTYMAMTRAMLTLDNTKTRVNLPVHHVSISTDQYFDHSVVEQHMRVIFTDFTEHAANVPEHAPSIMATKKQAKPLFPRSIRKVLKTA